MLMKWGFSLGWVPVMQMQKGTRNLRSWVHAALPQCKARVPNAWQHTEHHRGCNVPIRSASAHQAAQQHRLDGNAELGAWLSHHWKWSHFCSAIALSVFLLVEPPVWWIRHYCYYSHYHCITTCSSATALMEQISAISVLVSSPKSPGTQSPLLSQSRALLNQMGIALKLPAQVVPSGQLVSLPPLWIEDGVTLWFLIKAYFDLMAWEVFALIYPLHTPSLPCIG